MDKTNDKINYLLPKTNFWTGFSSVLSIFDSNPNNYKSNYKTDYRSLQSDWEVIGQDFRKALSKNY